MRNILLSNKNISIFLLIITVLITSPSLLLAQGMSGQGVPVSGHVVSTDSTPQASYKELIEQHLMEVPRPFDEELYLYKQKLIKGLILPVNINPHALIGDTAVELAPTSLPLLSTDFAGMDYTNWIPPDPILAVGPDYIVEMVNSSWAIFNKNGNKLYQTTLYNWWTNVSPSGFPFDPKLIFDHYSQRWVLLAVARSDAAGTSEYLISVSDDANPFGTWCNWKLDATLDGSNPTNNWPDYPQVGFDDDAAIYITSNQFQFGTFLYSKLRVLKKSELYWTDGCGEITWWDFWNFENADSSKVFTWQPVHTLSSSFREWLINTESRLAGNAITLWSVMNADTWPPTLTREATIPVQNFSAPPDAKQFGGSALIDTGDSRLYNAAYRDNKIYTATSESCDWGTTGNIESCIRFIVIDAVSKTAAIDYRFGADNFYYYYPAICPDNSGNIYAGFSRSGSTEYAGIRYTGKQSTEPYVPESVQLKAGEGYYVSSDTYGRNRWGDYSGIALDPSRGTIWINNEYATTFNTWGTWFGELSFGPPATITITSPTGGETWYTGDTNNINWTSSNAGPDVKIELSHDGGSTWSTITSSTPNVGSYAWTVTSPASSACRIRITSISYPSVSDMSSANFSIAARIPFTVSCLPDATTIPRGGTLGLQATVTNNTDKTGSVLAATKVTLPNGNWYPPSGYLFGPISVSFDPYQSKPGHLSHAIPSNAPTGTYTYHGYVGNYGVGIYHECQFNFEVTQ